jgi:Arc/MetJ-type ribon-helix-helix transcriptional regulator
MAKVTIHLPPDLLTTLKAEVNRAGVPLSEVVRQAIIAHLHKGVPATRLEALRSARGLWKGRKDLPDTAALRQDVEAP